MTLAGGDVTGLSMFFRDEKLLIDKWKEDINN